MIAKSFVDTNVLVYSVDRGAGQKQAVARDLLDSIRSEGRLCLSTQILCEFVNVLLTKLKVSPSGAAHLLASFKADAIVLVSPEIITEAISLATIAKINFWDSMVIEAAAFAGVKTLYTEDLNHGQIIRGVKVVNPFL
jgi:predicted nucleic acid-binding protein